MRTPFPYPGSKWSQRHEIWRRFGDPDHFIDPFCASCSVLLTRPWPSNNCKSELVNDLWGFITNFWRAVKHRPKVVAKYCLDMPNEIDVYARHAWLLAQDGNLEEMLRATRITTMPRSPVGSAGDAVSGSEGTGAISPMAGTFPARGCTCIVAEASIGSS